MLPDSTELPAVPPVTETPAVPPPLEPPPIPARAREPFWGYTDLAIFIGLLFASTVIIVAAVGIVVRFHPNLAVDQTPLILPTQFALYGFIYLSFYLLFRSRYRRPVLPSLGWRRSNFNLWITAIGGVVLAFAVAGLAALLHTPKVDSPMDKLAASPVLLAIFAVMAVTVAPLFEEMLFRGFIQPLLVRSFGLIVGIVLTAALFGSLHGPEYSFAWQYVAAVTLVGIVLGWIRARANSIIPSTIMHGCYNAIFVIALAITKHT